MFHFFENNVLYSFFSDSDCIPEKIHIKETICERTDFKMIFKVPDELLMKIFSNLKTQDLLQNVAFVNKKFNQIAMDADLLKDVALKDIDEYVYKDVENLLTRSRKLTKLVIKQNVLNPDQLIKVAFEKNKALKHLEIFGNIFEDFAFSLSEH